MNWDLYDFDRHWHPSDSTVVEFVAYSRRDERGGWDLFVFAPAGAVPELEAARRDKDHLFIEHVAEAYDLNAVVKQVEERLGDEYRTVPYYRESKSRVLIGRIYDHLRATGAHHMGVSGDGPDCWLLRIRRKDIPLAEQIALPNIPIERGSAP